MSNELETQLRAALTTTTNVTSGFDATYGVEIMKAVDKKIQDILNNSTPLRALIPRLGMNGQISYHWNIRTGNNTSSGFYSEGGNGTAATGAKVQLIATAKTFRTDWEVTGLSQEAMAAYFNAEMDEIMDAAIAHRELEEAQIVLGIDTTGGDASGFLGMKQLLNSFVTLSDTTTIFGIARASTKTYLDCQLENVAGDLGLDNLDNAVTAIEKKAGRAGMWLMSFAKADDVSALLQSQQRFNDTVQVPGGFVVPTYREAPIVKSLHMSYAGASDTDTAIFLLGANIWQMRVLKETSNEMADLGRYDGKGGYLKTYEVLVCKDLTKNCLLYGITE